jgi:cyclic-di-GMP-binding protein
MVTPTDSVGGYTNPPLQNLDRATAWLETLPRENLDAARAHISHMMGSFGHSRELLTVDGVNTLLHLDEGCQPVLIDILREFLQQPNNDPAKLNELCREMDSIYGELADAYARFIRVYHETRTSTKQIAQFMALVMGRALYCIGNRAKWNFFRQQVMDENVWSTAHNVYRYAELDGLLTTPIMLYARPYEISSSPGALYVRTVMLDTLSSGNFLPTQIETADHWLTSWSVKNTPDQGYIPEKHFYSTNLNFPAGARRAHAPKTNEDNRYLKTDYLAIEIGRAKDRLREGEIHFGLGFIAKQPIGEYLSLLDRLSLLWSPEEVAMDQRGEKRIEIVDETVQAIRGLNGLCECARQDYEKAHGPMDLNRGLSRDEEMDLQVYGFITERTRTKIRSRPLDATQPIPAVEQWQLRDESINGYGVSFPSTQYRHLKLGTLVGLKRRRSERWVVGVVTRLQNRKHPDESIAGIEIFTHAPVIVIVNEDVAAANAETSRSSWGLFIPGDKEAGRRDSLVIDGALYATKKQILMSARNVRYIVQLNGVLRSGEGWHRIEFDVVGKREVTQK